MKNRDVARAFAERRPGNALNFHTDGQTAWSYGTVIAYWHTDGHLHLNARRYSVSTSRHQSLIRSEIPKNTYDKRCEYEGPDAKMWGSWRDSRAFSPARPMSSQGTPLPRPPRHLRSVK